MNNTKTTPQQSLFWTVSDILSMTKRNLIRYIRLPRLLIFSTIQPVMFLLLFAYVFGGAISTPNGDYINYLIPGIIVQTVIFGAMQTGIGLSDDLAKGIIDRFRSLPMARSAVLAGRTLGDLGRNFFVVLLMTGVGFLIGFRTDQGILRGLLALAITVLFGYAFSWISATIGVTLKDPETAQVGGFIWVFPLVFASSIFVPVGSMPDWLQVFAENSPITITVNAVRELVLGGTYSTDLWHSILWSLGIMLVFIPIAIHRYRKIT